MSLKLSNETKTGIFVLICIVALVGLLLKVGNFTWFKKGYILKSRFHFTGGVKKNAPVRLSGVDVGVVRNIRLLYQDDTQVEMDLWVEEGTQVRLNSKAYVTTLGMMGEKYIEILVGSSDAPYAKDGETIASEDPVRLEDLIKIGTEVAGDIGEMARDISKVADRVDEAVEENRPRIDNIFMNLEETSENFNDFSQDVKYHPWKVLAKGKEVSKEQLERDRQLKRAKRAGGAVAALPVEASPAPSKQNFGSRKAS